MFDAKNAVRIAKEKAAEVLGQEESLLEELDLESSNGRDTWVITLSFARDLSRLPALAKLSADPLQYKKFYIDASTGDLMAIKVREFATR